MKFSTASIKVALILAIVMFFSVTFLALARANSLIPGRTVQQLRAAGVELEQHPQAKNLYFVISDDHQMPDPFLQTMIVVEPGKGLTSVAGASKKFYTDKQGYAIRKKFAEFLAEDRGYFGPYVIHDPAKDAGTPQDKWMLAQIHSPETYEARFPDAAYHSAGDPKNGHYIFSFSVGLVVQDEQTANITATIVFDRVEDYGKD